MKYLILSLTLLITFVACKTGDAPDKKSEIQASSETSDSEEKATMSDSKPTAVMSDFFNKYPDLQLPVNYPWNNAELGKIWMSKPFEGDDRSKICGSGVKCSDDEQLFYVGKYPLENGMMALLSFIVGDFNERLILSIHDRDEKMISNEVLNMSSEEVDYGYASSISKSFKIYRSKMFYSEGNQMEVDSEEAFKINDAGKIEAVPE